MRFSIWTAALAVGLLLVAACGGSGGAEGDKASKDGLAAACDSIADIESYRYTIALKLQSPAFQTTPIASQDPLGDFAEALTALFADMELEGAHVAPDRTQVVLRFQDEELELRSIGDKSWVRVGTNWQEQEAPPEPSALLTPQTVCKDTVQDLAASLSGLKPAREKVNGVDSDHYHLDEADLGRLSELLGTSAEDELPQRFQVDLWLARDGRWPVRLRIAATESGGEGQPAGLELFMEFQDINDPSIEIDPPPVAPLGT